MQHSLRISLLVLFAASTACEDQLDVLEGAADARAPTGMQTTLLSVGQFHACVIRNERVLCWGKGPRGALGQGSSISISLTPKTTATPLSAALLATGEHHSCSADRAGVVSCWGGNDQGQLGLGSLTDSFLPETLSLALGATRIAAGFLFTCAILRDQSLWCWGQNYEGQLAQGEMPEEASIPNPTRVGTDRDWLDVSCGQGHTCGIRTPGALYCWGRNESGELGVGDGASIQIRTPARVGGDDDWASVTVGQNQTCALKLNGTIWCWGSGADGQLGLGDRGNRSTPERLGSASGWDSISLNTFHACATTRGELWCWGRNVEGQLGTGDTEDRLTPDRIGSDSDWVSASAGRFHTCARKKGDTIWCAGANDEGELGSGDTTRIHVFTRIVGF